MTREATIRNSLSIKTTSLDYRSHPTAFVEDVSGEKGPVPGAFTATIAGTNVDLTELTIPGLCRIMNLDPTNYVDVGIWDPETLLFYPFMEVRPGAYYIFRLSRNLFAEYGTDPTEGTVGPNTNQLRIKANVASCTVLVEAFEA